MFIKYYFWLFFNCTLDCLKFSGIQDIWVSDNGGHTNNGSHANSLDGFNFATLKSGNEEDPWRSGISKDE